MKVTTTASVAAGKRALITGITGQDGSYLAELLLAKGYEVWGLVRRSSWPNTARIDELLATSHRQDSKFRFMWGDLGDASSLDRAISQSEPDEIYNLAAQSDVGISFDVPAYTGDVTALAVTRLLEATRARSPAARFYQASSSEIFGKVEVSPQTESTPFNPRSPYAAAKAYAFYMTKNYREGYGLFAVNGILFNHESPRRGENFVTRKISRAAARIKLGLQHRLRLGNLDARRDWGFAGDYVAAMWQMLQATEPDDYVIATGETHSVREFCELAFAHVGMQIHWEGRGLEETGVDEDGKELITIDPAFLRPTEVDQLRGNAAKARSELGWQPTTSFQELVEMMVEADLQTESV